MPECARLDCLRPPDGAGFKRCSACHSVWYCSVECQRAHWSSFHKWRCLPRLKRAVGHTLNTPLPPLPPMSDGEDVPLEAPTEGKRKGTKTDAERAKWYRQRQLHRNHPDSQRQPLGSTLSSVIADLNRRGTQTGGPTSNGLHSAGPVRWHFTDPPPLPSDCFAPQQFDAVRRALLELTAVPAATATVAGGTADGVPVFPKPLALLIWSYATCMPVHHLFASLRYALYALVPSSVCNANHGTSDHVFACVHHFYTQPSGAARGTARPALSAGELLPGEVYRHLKRVAAPPSLDADDDADGATRAHTTFQRLTERHLFRSELLRQCELRGVTVPADAPPSKAARNPKASERRESACRAAAKQALRDTLDALLASARDGRLAVWHYEAVEYHALELRRGGSGEHSMCWFVLQSTSSTPPAAVPAAAEAGANADAKTPATSSPPGGPPVTSMASAAAADKVMATGTGVPTDDGVLILVFETQREVP